MSSMGRRLPGARPRPPARLHPLTRSSLRARRNLRNPRGPTGGHGCDRAVRDEGRPCPHPAACAFGTVSSTPCCLSSSELCLTGEPEAPDFVAWTNSASPVLLHGEGCPSYGCCLMGCGASGGGTPAPYGLDTSGEEPSSGPGTWSQAGKRFTSASEACMFKVEKVP
jgi:hypothetical protein